MQSPRILLSRNQAEVDRQQAAHHDHEAHPEPNRMGHGRFILGLDVLVANLAQQAVQRPVGDAELVEMADVLAR